VAHFLVEAGHFGNAAGIVGDRAEASSATIMPARASMVATAKAMPNRPARLKVTMMPTTMTSAGSAVASSDTARPWMTLVPWPVIEASAMELTGRLPVPV
jgi:hypothetical protein